MSTEDKATDMRGTQCKHVNDQVMLYADFGPYLQYTTSTIASVQVSCDDDAALTFGTATVVSVDTTVPWLNEQGQVVQGTISANKGAKVLVSEGTVQASDAQPLRVLWSVTLNTGEVINRSGRLRVES
jgi:hypothetical protein